MTTRSTVEIEPIVVDMRRRTKAADRELREAIKKGTGYIDDLPPFLYIEYAMCSTAVGDLMLEYEIAAEHEAAGFRLVRLWMWIPADDAEFESAE